LDATGAYAQTGVLQRGEGDDSTWAAFVTFAAYALDTTVWDEHGRDLVPLADVGTSAVFRLTAGQADPVAAVAAPAVLAPVNSWRARRRQIRREQRRRWARLWRYGRA